MKILIILLALTTSLYAKEKTRCNSKCVGMIAVTEYGAGLKVEGVSPDGTQIYYRVETHQERAYYARYVDSLELFGRGCTEDKKACFGDIIELSNGQEIKVIGISRNKQSILSYDSVNKDYNGNPVYKGGYKIFSLDDL